jgi:hypothetical protein
VVGGRAIGKFIGKDSFSQIILSDFMTRVKKEFSFPKD